VSSETWRDTMHKIALNPKRNPKHDKGTWQNFPALPPEGFTYAIDGATGERVRCICAACKARRAELTDEVD